MEMTLLMWSQGIENTQVWLLSQYTCTYLLEKKKKKNSAIESRAETFSVAHLLQPMPG